jgi:6-phosphogluconolactonase
VSQFDVGAGGTLTPKTPASVAAGTFPHGVAVSPDGKSAYVTNAFDNTVSQYDIGAGGRLKPNTPASVGTGGFPLGVAVSPDGKSVYVTNDEFPGGTVSQYSIDPRSGALSPKTPATVATGGGPAGIAVTPLPRVPTSKQQCKNGGWHNFPQFKNQGDCVSFVENGK